MCRRRRGTASPVRLPRFEWRFSPPTRTLRLLVVSTVVPNMATAQSTHVEAGAVFRRGREVRRGTVLTVSKSLPDPTFRAWLFAPCRRTCCQSRIWPTFGISVSQRQVIRLPNRACALPRQIQGGVPCSSRKCSVPNSSQQQERLQYPNRATAVGDSPSRAQNCQTSDC